LSGRTHASHSLSRIPGTADREEPLCQKLILPAASSSGVEKRGINKDVFRRLIGRQKNYQRHFSSLENYKKIQKVSLDGSMV
jgi:hypothetical protein